MQAHQIKYHTKYLLEMIALPLAIPIQTINNGLPMPLNHLFLAVTLLVMNYDGNMYCTETVNRLQN